MQQIGKSMAMHKEKKEKMHKKEHEKKHEHHKEHYEKHHKKEHEKKHEHMDKKKKHMSKAETKIKKVAKEFSEGKLHSGSKKGPIVTNPKQMVAIGYSEAKRGKKK
jgi:Family of unknown function (DUF6496)